MDLQKIKKMLKKIFILPPIPTLLVAIPSYILVIYVLVNGLENEIISYVAYLLSAYAAIITVTGIAEIVRLVRQGIKNHPFVKKAFSVSVIEKYFREVMFRTETSLYQGLFINLLYVILKFCSGIYYRSVWFMSLSFYYLLLVSMLSLETAMIAQFGGDDSVFRQIMTSATGAGVCVIVLGMAVYMIIKSTKLLKNIDKGQGGNA